MLRSPFINGDVERFRRWTHDRKMADRPQMKPKRHFSVAGPSPERLEPIAWTSQARPKTPILRGSRRDIIDWLSNTLLDQRKKYPPKMSWARKSYFCHNRSWARESYFPHKRSSARKSYFCPKMSWGRKSYFCHKRSWARKSYFCHKRRRTRKSYFRHKSWTRESYF